MKATARFENYVMDDLGRSLEVVSWPRPLRRAFILTLPISAPAYMVWALTFMLIVCVGFCVAALIEAWD